MGRQGREDFYRNDRDYASLLGDQEDEEEDVEEDVEEEQEGRPEKEEDGNFTQECQEYYERRERLKELERQRLRRSSDNGKRDLKATNKPLPYDKCRLFGSYGSFFGPSEPIVARRIIADARAREEASKVAARQTKEISEQHRISKGSSGVSKSVSQSLVVEKPKQSASTNEASLRLRRLKEARDYSFLFTDEDPAASPPRNDAQATKRGSEDHDRPKQASTSVKGGSTITQRSPNPVKMGASTLAKQTMGAKATKANISPAPKGLQGQQRQPNPTPKLSKPPERPSVSKAKVSSQSGSSSHPSKTISGPGRPPQARPTASSQGISNGKKPLLSSTAAQLKSLVASGPKGAGKQSMPSTAAKVTSGKAAPQKLASAGGFEKKPSQLQGGKSQASTSRPDQKRPGVVTVGRGPSAGSHDQRRPAQSAAMSKQDMKPRPRMPKRPRESESEDSFLDDDDEGGGDFSSVIRKMFRYNPNKYRDLDDEDDRSMITNFHSLQMEEKRSARIAREEDERELALIEEEERREREMAKKKRKQQR